MGVGGFRLLSGLLKALKRCECPAVCPPKAPGGWTEGGAPPLTRPPARSGA